MNPIEKAVLPLKQMAIDRAREYTQRRIDQALLELEGEHNWNVTSYAPWPSPFNMSNYAYDEARAKNRFIYSICKITKRKIFKGEPELLAPDQKLIEKRLQEAEDAAILSYDAYVNKLNKKIGEVKNANLTDVANLWNYSILNIEKEDGTVQRWKTQCIVNVSVLGKLFNQWPTRLMKK